MKFDAALMRSIMLMAEEAPVGKILDITNAILGGQTASELAEHVFLLHEEGYIDAQVIRLGDSVSAIHIHRLTMKGHEFVRNARNDTVWKKVTAAAKEKGVSLSMHLLNSVLEKASERFLGLN